MMKTTTLLILYCFFALPAIITAKPIVQIIPRPQTIQMKEGHFMISSTTSIIASEGLRTRAKQLENYLEPTLGFDLAIASKGNNDPAIELKLDKTMSQLSPEAYRLEIGPKRITVSAATDTGIFWGIQTIRQLLPAEVLRSAPVQNMAWEMPCLLIEDAPRFKWRGLMLDCSRTFIPKEQVKKYLEAMSYFKMNVLHMHLTDDQGWRLEIRKYPELTSISSKFHESFNEPKENEGFYSQEDIRELVAFAAQRNIEIVPEIEMPGHTTEVFAAFPNLSCSGDTLKIHPWLKGAGIHGEVFCAGNEQTFEFLQNVLKEVAELFPSGYIHIGGDEAPKNYWKSCIKCQDRLKAEGLKDENELQSWFVRRIEKFVNSKGKKLIGWDEIMDGGLSPSATVMYWRSWSKTVAERVPEIANNVVMTPTSHCYFDYTYEKISTERMYAYNPVFENDPTNKLGKILGVQANFWSHLDRTAPRMDQQLFPRLIALAEVAWTNQDRKDWGDFKFRLDSKLKCLDLLGLNYYGKN